METRILKVDPAADLGHFADAQDAVARLETWVVPPAGSSPALAALEEAASQLRNSDIPVAFPTETVYGLGADATRSAAVRGIYEAKRRPADNPLIVHVSDLAMLRALLRPAIIRPSGNGNGEALQNGGGLAKSEDEDAAVAAVAAREEEEEPQIPAIYAPLIERFWPGPLTILLRNPAPSRLAPEVTAGLATFGARMPASALARTLIALAGAPLAAPSANASTRPSPTAAGHVVDDLRGRLALVVDGGVCGVGVESTVVDGLCEPPAVLRPGGVGIEVLRACPGWGGVVRAYKDASEKEGSKEAPRAPGMKYKHYSPRARVVLYEAAGSSSESLRGDGVAKEDLEDALARPQDAKPGVEAGRGVPTIGVIRTKRWPIAGGIPWSSKPGINGNSHDATHVANGDNEGADEVDKISEGEIFDESTGTLKARVLDISLGQTAEDIAQGLFAALRSLDSRGADVIFVEGIGDGDDIGAAVMNRLRKAASEIR